MKTKQKLFKWVKEHKLICYSDVMYNKPKKLKITKFNKQEVMLDFEQQLMEVI